MIKEINFDMDGTIANLYAEENWLDDIINEKVNPYLNAKPMLNMDRLASVLNKLQANGYEINVITWTSKNATNEFNTRIEKAKKTWLKLNLNVKFDNIYVIPYGTPKANYGKGILFDDEKPNRDNWNGIAYDEKEILKILNDLN